MCGCQTQEQIELFGFKILAPHICERCFVSIPIKMKQVFTDQVFHHVRKCFVTDKKTAFRMVMKFPQADGPTGFKCLFEKPFAGAFTVAGHLVV